MSPLLVVPIGSVDALLLEAASSALADELGESCTVAATRIDPAPAFHSERNQYHSTELLESLVALRLPSRIVGITDVDLYIPILTFVFGEAEMDGRCAVVSCHRLQQDFYGLPPDDAVTAARLRKEAVHEAGHTFGLVHCDDYECVMAPSHAVEWLDLKGQSFCAGCFSKLHEVSARDLKPSL